MKHFRLSWSAGLLLLIGFLASAGSAKAQVTLCLGDAVPNGWGITSYGVDFRCGNPTPQVPKTSKVIARFDNLFDGDTFDSCTPLIVNAPPDFVIVFARPIPTAATPMRFNTRNGITGCEFKGTAAIPDLRS